MCCNSTKADCVIKSEMTACLLIIFVFSSNYTFSLINRKGFASKFSTWLRDATRLSEIEDVQLTLYVCRFGLFFLLLFTNRTVPVPHVQLLINSSAIENFWPHSTILLSFPITSWRYKQNKSGGNVWTFGRPTVLCSCKVVLTAQTETCFRFLWF